MVTQILDLWLKYFLENMVYKPDLKKATKGQKTALNKKTLLSLAAPFFPRAKTLHTKRMTERNMKTILVLHGITRNNCQWRQGDDAKPDSAKDSDERAKKPSTKRTGPIMFH
jgi:hypothetical protein